MAKEYLVDLYETAMKAADAAAKDDGGSAEENRCIDALRKLKSFPVDFKILVETQAGKNLRKLTKHPRKKIQASAVDLIAIWKKKYLEAVAAKKKKKKKTEKSDNKLDSNGGGTKRPGSRDSCSPRPAKMVKLDSEETKPLPLTRSMLNCNDDARDKLRRHIWEALCKVCGEADEKIQDEVKLCDPIRVAISVETALFKKLGRLTQVGAHRAKYRSVIFNLKDDHNPDFRRKVLLGIVKAESVPEMSSEEMASDKRKVEIADIRAMALFRCERYDKDKATTDQFKCDRCGKNKCRYNQAQTRSADEPMTTYVTCVECDHMWKFC